MAEGENAEERVSETRRQKERNEVGINVDYWSLWDEVKNFRDYFNWGDLASGTVFELLPSLWDLQSDFTLADKWRRESINLTQSDARYSYKGDNLGYAVTLTYLFLSIPGLVLGLTSFYNRVLMRCFTCRFTDYCIAKVVGYIILMALVGSIIIGVIGIIVSDPDSSYGGVLFTTAILTSVWILSTKLLRVFVHGPQTKKLSVKMSAIEGQNESCFQLLLITKLIIYGTVENPGTAELMGIASSLVMIAKAGAENLLTFGSTNKLDDKGFWQKWKLLLSFTPLLTMTCLFRVMTAAVWFGHPWIGTVALPLIIILLLKICLPSLSSLTPLDIIQGVVSELSIPSIWGNLGREKSRNLQLGMTICHLVVNTGFLVTTIWIYAFPSAVFMVQEVAITALVCGWVSFPLYLYQIYWAVNWDKLGVMATI